MADTEITEVSGHVEQQAPQTSSKRKAEWFELDDGRNTYVYVSGMPKTMTEQEFVDLMQKYGIIATKPIRGNPLNIKLYKDQDGNLKGDGLCCYVRVESVELALEMLDNYIYDSNHVINCERAKFELKGSYDPSKKPRPVDKKAKLKHKQRLEKKLSWEPKREVEQRTVILKSMFTLEELEDNVEILNEVKAYVDEKCEALQLQSKRRVIFENHPEGPVSVYFPDGLQARAFVASMDNVPYRNRHIQAELWDGVTNYKIKETEEQEKKRLERWHQHIQKEEEDDEEGQENPDVGSSST